MTLNIPYKFNPMPYYTTPTPVGPDYTTMPLTFKAINGSATVSLQRKGSTYSISLQYSTDGGNTWSSYSIGNTISLSQDGTVAFSGVNGNGFSKSLSDRYYFSIGGSVQVFGNLLSLINFATAPSNIEGWFNSLFRDCSQIKSLKNLTLPTTIAPWSIYQGMFTNCYYFSEGPAILPATTLKQSAYFWMFESCSSLKVAPLICATDIQNTESMDHMFTDCSNLSAVEVKFTDWAWGYKNNNSVAYANNQWMNGVQTSKGIFIKPSSWNLPNTDRGSSKVPNNWVILNRNANKSLTFAYSSSWNGTSYSAGDTFPDTDPYAWYYA